MFTFSLKGKPFKTILLCLGLMLPLVSQAFAPGKGNNTVRFIENKGQWHPKVRYKARIPGGQLFISNNTLTYQFWDQRQVSRYHHKKDSGERVRTHVLKMQFSQANKRALIREAQPSSHAVNFYKGKSPHEWVTGLKAYRTLRLKNVYSGIDFILKGTPNGIKYNFHVSPKADPSEIAMQWKGAESLQIKHGALKATTSLKPLKENPPVAYALGAKGQKKETIQCEFKLDGRQVQFAIPDAIPENQELLIDPEVVFATFSGSYADNFGFTGTFDSAGHAYSAGTVYSAGFPTTAGAFILDFQGGDRVDGTIGKIARDAGILKYSKDGSRLLYATYLGGSGNEQPHSMIVNSQQELLVFGTTYSTNFPTHSGAYQRRIQGQSDVYVTRFSPDGSQLLSGTLIGGTFRDGLNGKYQGGSSGYRNRIILGYNYGDLYRGEIMVDSQDNVYLASSTQSADFPTTGGSFQQNFGGGFQDGFVAKLGPGLEQLKWSTFLGGNLADAAYSLKVNAQQEVYVTGGTRSRNFPVDNQGYQSSVAGGADGYVVKLSSDGQRLPASTYLGSPLFDQAYFVELGSDGGVYLTGQTEGDFPVKNTQYRDANSGQFVSKFNGSLSNLVYSTVFGSGDGTPDISPAAFLVDVCGNIYVSGWGGRTNVTSHSEATRLQNMPISSGAYQSRTDGSDFYLAVFRAGMDSLLYGSYFGGRQSDEHVDGGTSRFDKRGMVYQSVCGGCHGNSDFPVTENAHSKTNNSDFGCNNAFVKLKLDVANQKPAISDETVSLKVTDTLTMPLPVKDPDNDTVIVSGEGKLFKASENDVPPARIEKAEGKAPHQAKLVWPTQCVHAGKTFKLSIQAKDEGCPAPKKDQAVITVKVDSLPGGFKPPVFCSKVINRNTFKLSWDSLQGKPTISHYELVRIGPRGDTLTLDSINPRKTQTYTDNKAFELRDRAYCYFLRTINRCGKTVNSSYTICTGPDYKNRPQSINMEEVTVKNDENVRLTWPPSRDKDFAEYQLLKKPRKSPNQAFQVFKRFSKVNDTAFTDPKPDVDEESYCYKLRVQDVCGFYSELGKQGCNIVLKGQSEPFKHFLDWQRYKNWPAGISHYKVFRRDPVVDTQFQPIARILPSEVEYLDDELNTRVGAYWYKVKAYEQASTDLKNSGQSQSQSNTIYLEQKPLLHVPSAFTINRDGINEHWGVKPVFVKDIHIQVFNRWGAEVYETRDIEDRWYGPPTGKAYQNKMSDNVYLYKIYYKGWDDIQRSKTGDVTILK